MNINVTISKYMKDNAGRISAVEYSAIFTHDDFAGASSSTSGLISSDLDADSTIDDMKEYVSGLIRGDVNLISVHLSDLRFKHVITSSQQYTTSPPLTPEELREQMPPISKRQLRLTLTRNGISLDDLDTAILAMGEEAIIEWQDASEYRRLHPLLNQVAAYLALSHEQVDAMWQQAIAA